MSLNWKAFWVTGGGGDATSLWHVVLLLETTLEPERKGGLQTPLGNIKKHKCCLRRRDGPLLQKAILIHYKDDVFS